VVVSFPAMSYFLSVPGRDSRILQNSLSRFMGSVAMLSLTILIHMSVSSDSLVVYTAAHFGHDLRLHTWIMDDLYLELVVISLESHNTHTMTIYCAYASVFASG
jgi:hypothetical protein